MQEPFHRVLILDSDAEMLITLQRVFENDAIDTTITWDEAEACHLIESTPYDLLLSGDRRPQLDPALMINRLSFRGMCPSVLVLGAVISENEVGHFRRVGATGVVPRHNSLNVLEKVKSALAGLRPRVKARKAGSIDELLVRAA